MEHQGPKYCTDKLEASAKPQERTAGFQHLPYLVQKLG